MEWNGAEMMFQKRSKRRGRKPSNTVGTGVVQYGELLS